MDLPKEIQDLNELLRPRWVSGLWNVDHVERPSEPKTHVQLHLWKWQDVYDSLLQARDRVPVASGSVERRVIRLVNPGMGKSEMTSQTILLSFQLIQPGELAPAHRHTSTVLYHAFRGSGSTVINGKPFHWEKGDTFVVPLWHWHEHANTASEDAILFSMNDAPVLKPFGLYREQGAGEAH